MFEITGKRLEKLRSGVARLARPSRRWVSLDFFTIDEVSALLDLAEVQTFREAQNEVTHGTNRVFQDFDVCFPGPRIGVFNQLAESLEDGLFAAGSALSENPFQTRFRLDDFAIQRYRAGSRGIGIHRDGKRYRYIVVIVTLAGCSRLFATATRAGDNRRRIDDRPGRLVLLSANGFFGRDGEDARPLHGVDHVSAGRLSLGLRSSA